MKIFKVMSILIAFTILFASCHKDTTKPNTQASEYFPNSVGDYWEYDAHDSTAGYTEVENYTVKVTIVGITKLIDSNDAYIWQYQYPSGNDTNYVRIVGDTVKIYDAFRIETVRGLEFPLKVYIIPFSNEQRWDGKLLLIDSFHVYTSTQVETPAEVFTNCFDIYHYYLAPNTEDKDNDWFKSNVGIVKSHHDSYDLAPRTIRAWELKKYYLH